MPDQIANASRRPEGASLQAHSLKAMAAEEARRFVVLFLYLWVLFAVFVLNQSIVLREQGILHRARLCGRQRALVLALLFSSSSNPTGPGPR